LNSASFFSSSAFYSRRTCSCLTLSSDLIFATISAFSAARFSSSAFYAAAAASAAALSYAALSSAAAFS